MEVQALDVGNEISGLVTMKSTYPDAGNSADAVSPYGFPSKVTVSLMSIYDLVSQ
jgi:hypothetical protein